MKKFCLLMIMITVSRLSAMQPCALPCANIDACQNNQTSHVSVFANALYWQAGEEGLDYMIKNNTGATFINCGNVERVKFDWNGGFRVGLGYCHDCCPMGVNACYTRFTTGGNDSVSATFPEVLFPVWSNPSTNIVTEKEAQTRLKLLFEAVDLQLSTLFSPNCCVNLMPVLGVRYARINQRFNINASGGQSLGPIAFVLDDAIAMKNNFWGVGPKVGINSTWGSWHGLSIFGAMDFALLSGTFDIKQREDIVFTDGVPATTFLNIKDNRFHLVRPNLNIILGLQWDWQICGGHALCFSAGWEQQFFFGQNQLMRFSDDVNPGVNTAVQGDFSTRGLTVAVSYSY